RPALPSFPTRRSSDLLLLGDPFTFPMDVLLRIVNESCPGLPVFGGMASGGGFPGANRLLLDGEVRDEGAVGLVMHGDVVLETVRSEEHTSELQSRENL